MTEAYHTTLKIILLGDYMVNKTVFLKTLSAVPKQPEASCLGFRYGVVDMLLVRDGKRIRVKVNDTAGQERFRSITSSYYRGAHGCILLFDVTQKSTFHGVNEWHRELSTNGITDDDIPLMLVGCWHHSGGGSNSTTSANAIPTTLATANSIPTTTTHTTITTSTITSSTTSPPSSSAEPPDRQVPRSLAQEFADYLGGVPYEELSLNNVASTVRVLNRLVDRILSKASSARCSSSSFFASPTRIASIKPREVVVVEEGEEGQGAAGRTGAVTTKCAC